MTQTFIQKNVLYLSQVDVVLAEPFFLTSVLPWHNLHLGYAVREITQHLSPGVKVLPGTAVLRIMAVQFSDLWKIRAPVGICEGFNLESFDKLIEVMKMLIQIFTNWGVSRLILLINFEKLQLYHETCGKCFSTVFHLIYYDKGI